MKKQELLRLSPSSINTYIRCPREFYYSYVLRLPQPSSIHLIKGIIVHTVFEKFFGKTYRPDFENYCEELFWKEYEKHKEEWDTLVLSEKETKTEQEDCLNIISIFLHSFRLKIDMLLNSGKAKNIRHAWYSLKPQLKELWLEDEELNPFI